MFVVLLLWVALAAVAAPALGAEELETVVLDNGLTVLLSPSHAHPVIAVQAYVTTGGRTEDEYYQGSLHYIEHLVFKGGTPNLPPTQFRKKMSLLGQESGGWTWDDEINFGFEVPKENFAQAMSIFREGLLDLEFEKDWFEDEKKVVFQEQEMGFEQPDRLIYHAWDDLAFTTHPYGRPVIGSRKAVAELEMTRTEEYYRQRFTPNHMILSVSGDFERAEMLEKIKAEWGKLTPGPESFELGLVEPEQRGPRRRDEHLSQATSSLILTGVVTAGAAHEDTPALMLLADLMNDGSFGLRQYLEEQEKWVTEVSADHYAMRDHGTFRVFARVPPENAAAVLDFAQRFLVEFDVHTIPSEIFEATRRARLAAEERERATFAERAGRLGFLASRMGSDGARSLLTDIKALTPEDVQAAKERWLVKRRLTTVVVHPEAFDPPAAIARAVEPASPKAVAVPDLDVPGALQPAAGEALSYQLIDSGDGVHVYEYENGLRLVIRPSDASRILAVTGRVLGGQWVEPPDQAGINRFTAELGMRATRRWDREGFSRLLGSLAIEGSAHMDVGSRANTSLQIDYRDSGAHHYAGLADQAPQILAILKETLFFPSFEAEEVGKLRGDLLDEIRRLPERNLEYIKQEFYVRAYAGHPYGRPTMGTESTIGAITPDHLRRFHADAWTPDRTVVSIVGDVDPGSIAAWIASRWSDLPDRKAGPVPTAGLNGWSPPHDVQLLDLGKDQWTVNWGRPGVGYNDDRHVLSRVLANLAGNEHFYRYVYEEGVSYRSWIQFWGQTLGPGAWILENDVQRERFDEVLASFDRDLARYAESGFTREEFDEGIQRLCNGHVLGLQENPILAWRLALAVGNGAGFRRVTRTVEDLRAVAYDDVQALAAEIFRPDEILRLVQK